jgi:hypothetical protein
MAVDDTPDLDRLTRAELADVDADAAAVAAVLDAWLYSEHGVASSHHGAGAFLDELAAAGYRVTPIEAPAFADVFPAATD